MNAGVKSIYSMIASIALLTAVVFVVGCTSVDNGSQQMRFLEDHGNSYHAALVRDDMRAMANSVRTLRSLEYEVGISDEKRLEGVQTELAFLAGTARLIKAEGEIYNYAVLSPYLGAFLRDVKMAREFASQVPPDYQPAFRIIESCLLCHKY